MSKGDAAFNAGDYYDAIVFYKKVKQYNLEEAMEKMNKSREKISDQQRREFYFEIDAAKNCFKRGEYEKAKKHYLKVAKYSSTGLSAEIAECEKKIQEKQAMQKVLDTKRCPSVPSVTDYDGNKYRTVQLGYQCWMAENVRTTHYWNGVSIPLGNDLSGSQAYRYYPYNDSLNVPLYGYLYNWSAFMGGASPSDEFPSRVQGACPKGWHMPSIDEWDLLGDYLTSHGSMYSSNEHRPQKWFYAIHSPFGWEWPSGIVPGENERINATGFSALPTGIVGISEKSNNIGFSTKYGKFTFFGSTSVDKNNNILGKYVGYHEGDVNWLQSSISLQNGISIRCVYDSLSYKSNIKSCGIVVDYDGNTYNTVQIGEQCWMRENLRTTHYADGKRIKQLSLPKPRQNYYKLSKSPGFYQVPDSNNPEDGLLYNWYATMQNKSTKKKDDSTIQGACPDGWHIPSYEDWKLLEEQYSWTNELAAQTGWERSKESFSPGYHPILNNTVGYTALPVGVIKDEGFKSNCTTFWSYKFYSKESEIREYSSSVYGNKYYMSHLDNLPQYGYSVRCIRD